MPQAVVRAAAQCAQVRGEAPGVGQKSRQRSCAGR